MDDYRERAEFERALVTAYPDLLRFAEVLTGSHADARDLVQDAMARGLSRRERFHQGGSVKGWLATILRRIFIDKCRQSRVAAHAARRADLESATADDEPAPRPAPWEAFTIEDVRRALMFVSPSLRTAYAMFALERLSHAEIGRRLSLPAGTVATRVFRARQRLRDLLVSGEFRLRPVAPISVPASPARCPLRPAIAGNANVESRQGGTPPYRATKRSQRTTPAALARVSPRRA
jgi:RNA polymerase sigma-70 factor (ECF subfamily)